MPPSTLNPEYPSTTTLCSGGLQGCLPSGDPSGIDLRQPKPNLTLTNCLARVIDLFYTTVVGRGVSWA